MSESAVRNAYLLPPGRDFFTGSIKTPVIDTGVDIDKFPETWGRVYLSADTVGGYARMLGWASPDEVTKLRAELDMARLALDDAEAAAVEQLERAERYRALLAAEFPDKGGEASGEGSSPNDPSSDAITDFPHHDGSGWYSLSDGSQLRGREAAEAAQAAIDKWGDDE